jgi:hypothetical protein
MSAKLWSALALTPILMSKLNAFPLKPPALR